MEQGLSAQRIWQDLRGEHGFAGGYDSVKRFVRPAEAGEPAAVPADGVRAGRRRPRWTSAQGRPDRRAGAAGRRRPHVFRIVLSHSRKAYSEVVYRQTTEDFIRCLENAFWHFGGVPRTLVIDNLKAAVTQADWYDPDSTRRSDPSASTTAR